MNGALLGIEIGGTKLQLVVGEPSGTILERHRFAVDRQEGAAGLRRQIESTLGRLTAAARPQAVGVGFGGPVDHRSGRICCSHHVEGWSEYPLGPWIESLTRAPVRVDNDANVAALGEALCGAGRQANPVFYVTLGSGVGGGLVVEGAIYHGALPGEAELGHVRLSRDGTTVESRCAGWAVDRRIREHVAIEPTGELARLVAGQVGGEARHLAEAVRRGDTAAGRILADTAGDLAFGLSHVVHLFHPQVIVVGGGLALLGEPLRAAVNQALPGLVMEAFHPAPPVVLSALAEDAVPVGALLLAAKA